MLQRKIRDRIQTPTLQNHEPITIQLGYYLRRAGMQGSDVAGEEMEQQMWAPHFFDGRNAG